LQGGRWFRYAIGGESVISLPEPYFWRAPTDN